MFDPEHASPTEVVGEVLRLLEAEDYDAAAELHHPNYAEHVMATVSRDANPQLKIPTVEGLLKLYPDMPTEAAEYQVKQAQNRPPRPPYLDELFGVESTTDLDGLTPTQALARRLQGLDHRWRLREYLDELTSKHPKYREQLEQQRSEMTYMWSGKLAGHVERGERAYVVVDSPDRALDEYPDDHVARLVILRRFAEGWRISSDVAPSPGLVQFHVRVQNDKGDTVVLS